MTTGDVEMTVLDGGAGVVVTPATNIQVVLGTCSSGTVGQIVASRNKTTLASVLGYGPLVEAAAMAVDSGAVVLAMKLTSNAAGVASAVTQVAAGTSIMTVTGTPFDAYLVKVVCTNAGTIATTGIRIKISLDAGRSYGPEISIGTAVTYAIVGTGLTLAFAAGTMLLAGVSTFSCTEPLANTAGVQAALAVLEASPFSVTGWGSMHILGPWTGANATTIQGYLDTMVTTKTFTHAIVGTRDCALPVAWAGAGETDAAWSAAVGLDYSAVSTKRIMAVAGHYNMSSPYQVPAAGSPVYRRPGSWAAACRTISSEGGATPPQRHLGRVQDGAVTQIVIDPTNDQADGFNYHDDFQSPTLDTARFTSFRTRKGKPGFFVKNPKMMSPPGSVFVMQYHRRVMDIGCALLHQSSEANINNDILLNDNGTIDEVTAQGIETIINGVTKVNMADKGMIVKVVTVIDRSNNIRATDTVNVAQTLYGKGYILEIQATIGFASPFAVS